MMAVRESFNGMIVSAAISAAFELGLLHELKASEQIDLKIFAASHDLDFPSVRALADALAYAGVLYSYGEDVVSRGPEFHDAWTSKGYFLWLVRGYGDVLRQTADLCRNSAGAKARLMRDGAFIATAGKDYGEHFVDPVFSAVLSDVGFRNAADLGCGSAGRLIELARRHPRGRFLGVELNRGAVEVALAGVRAAGLEERITIVNADITALEPGRFRGFDLVFSFFLGHDLWPAADCARAFAGLRAALPDVQTFLLSDTYRSAAPVKADPPIFTLGFEYTHSLMRQYVPSLEEWKSFFAGSQWNLAAVHDLAIPHSAIFQLTPADIASAQVLVG